MAIYQNTVFKAAVEAEKVEKPVEVKPADEKPVKAKTSTRKKR